MADHVVFRADEAEQFAMTLGVSVEQLRGIEREVLSRDAAFRARRYGIQGGPPPAAAQERERPVKLREGVVHGPARCSRCGEGTQSPTTGVALATCFNCGGAMVHECGPDCGWHRPPAAADVSEEAIGNAARNYVAEYSEAGRPCGDSERLLTVADREALIRLGAALGGRA